MMQFLRTKGRDAVSAIFDASVRVMTREGMVEEKVLQAVVDDAQLAAGVKKEVRTADYFRFQLSARGTGTVKGERVAAVTTFLGEWRRAA